MGHTQELDYTGGTRAHRVLSRIFGGRPWPPAYFLQDCDCCTPPDDPCNSVNCTYLEEDMQAIVVNFLKSRPLGATEPDTISGSSVQSTGRGNDPPSREVGTTIHAEAGQFGDLFVVNMTTFDWSPGIKGAVQSLGVCLDGFLDSESYLQENGTSRVFNVDCWFILKQSGKTFGYKLGGLNAANFWRRLTVQGLTASAFSEIYSGERPSGAGLLDTSSHPNFSTAGDTITFGWAVQPESSTSRQNDTDSETTTFWDNFCLKIEHDDVIVNPATCTLFSGDPGNWVMEEVEVQFTGTTPRNNAIRSVSVSATVGNLAPSLKLTASPRPIGNNGRNKELFAFHPTSITPGNSYCGLTSVGIRWETNNQGYWIPPPTPNVYQNTPCPACRQGGKIYVKNISEGNFKFSALWYGFYDVAIESEFVEFKDVFSPIFGNIDHNSHPDFSVNGGDIEFGIWCRGPSNSDNGTAYFDNLCITLNPGANQVYQIDLTGYSFTPTKLVNSCGNMNAQAYQCIIDACNQLLQTSIIFCGTSLFWFFTTCPGLPNVPRPCNGNNFWWGRLNIVVSGNQVTFDLYAPGQTACGGACGLDRIGSFVLSSNGANINSFLPVALTGSSLQDANNSNNYCRCNTTIGSAATITRIQ